MDYSYYRNKYINILSQWKKQNIPDWKAFEYAVALDNSMIVWSDIPPSFGEVHKLPHLMDYGIDCIDLGFTKTLQAKYYNSSNITWKLMSTYIAYSVHILGITDINLVTTSSAKVTDMVLRSFPKILRYTLEELTETLPEIPKIEKPLKVIEQRPYTVECANLFLQSDQEVMRFELPCGVGKSYIVYEIIKRSIADDCNLTHLIIVPWIDLANQMLAELTDFGLKASLIGDGHHFDGIDGLQVLVCITASVKRLAEMSLTFGYKFVDEAHHIEKSESVQLGYINEIECDRELHLSATFRKIHPLDYCMTLRDAIDGGWLSDYRIYIEYFTEGEMFPNIVQLVKTNPDWFPMFVYFNTTERAIEFAKQVGGEYLIGTCSRSKRARIINDLNEYRCPILALCGCFNEGISINNLATIVFGDYRFSKINRIQIAMRASRLHPNKPFSRLVFPVCKGGLEDKDLQAMLKSFGEIDPKLSHSMRNNGTRVSIVSRNEQAEIVQSEFICEKIYNSFGKLMGRLTLEERIDEFLEWVIKNDRVPKQFEGACFSNGQKMGIFWIHCRDRDNLDKPKYLKLKENAVIQREYSLFLDHKEFDKAAEFVKYIEANGLPKNNNKDTFCDGVSIRHFWQACKSKRRLEMSEYAIIKNNKLAYDDYLKFLEKVKTATPKISVEDRIKEFLGWVAMNNKLPKERNNTNMFSDGICMGKYWNKCTSYGKLSKEPYVILLSNKLIREAYDSYLARKSARPEMITLTTHEKNKEFIEWVNKNGCVPLQTCKDRMSNTVKFSSYWTKLKCRKRLDEPEYFRLLEVDIIRDAYYKSIEKMGKTKYLDRSQKIDEFITWVKINGRVPVQSCKDKFSDGTGIGVYWSHCRSIDLLSKPEYSKMLGIDIIKNEYQKPRKVKPDNILPILDKIEELINWARTNGRSPSQKCEDTFSDGSKMSTFWFNCKNKSKCMSNPYSKLLEVDVLQKDYSKVAEIKITNSKKHTLPTPEKIDEFLNWVNINKRVPTSNCEEKFSDNTKIGGYWVACKSYKKLDKPEYAKLLQVTILKKDYDDCLAKNAIAKERKKMSIPDKMEEFVEWVNTNGCTPAQGKTGKAVAQFSDGSKVGLYWSNCKNKLKCHKRPYLKLLENPIMRENYIACLKNTKPEEWDKVDRVNKFINLVNKNGLPKSGVKIGNYCMTPYDYWEDVKQNKRCEGWPYIELLSVQVLKDDYNTN